VFDRRVLCLLAAPTKADRHAAARSQSTTRSAFLLLLLLLLLLFHPISSGLVKAK